MMTTTAKNNFSHLIPSLASYVGLMQSCMANQGRLMGEYHDQESILTLSSNHEKVLSRQLLTIP